MCGVVGLKPTYGRVSRYGLIAFGSSLDQIGPLARTVHDAAIALGVIAGADPADATSAPEPVADYAGGADRRHPRHCASACRRGWSNSGVDPEVAGAFKASLDALACARRHARRHRAAAREVRDAVYYLVATAEASSNLARYDGVRYGFRAEPTARRAHRPLRTMYARTREHGFGAEVKRRIMLGTYVLSAGYYEAYYLKAQQVRTLILRDYDQAFERVDVVAMPTSPTPAFKLGERVADPLQMYLADVFTVSANLAGLPGDQRAVRLHRTDRLPIGLQLTGRRFDEATLLRIADAYERDTDWWKQVPEIPILQVSK